MRNPERDPDRRRIEQMRIRGGMTARELLEEMEKVGVFGAGRLARAYRIMLEMFSDRETMVMLSLAGPLVVGGLREIISRLIRLGFVDIVISSGGNMVHDIIEALGGEHLVGLEENDLELRRSGFGRIMDALVPSESFVKLERFLRDLFEEISREKKVLGTAELFDEIGRRLDDEESILRSAHESGARIYSPGLFDSMIGLHLWLFNQRGELIIDVTRDMAELSDRIFSAKRIGAIILGGGLSKHFLLGSTILRGGIDLGIQITMDRPETGSLSGAQLEEGISWSKVGERAKLATVIGDCTMVFPILVSACLEALGVDR